MKTDLIKDSSKEALTTKHRLQVIGLKGSAEKEEEQEENIPLEDVDTETSKEKVKIPESEYSFNATRNFFLSQDGGLIIAPKKYKKVTSVGADEGMVQHKTKEFKDMDTIRDR